MDMSMTHISNVPISQNEWRKFVKEEMRKVERQKKRCRNKDSKSSSNTKIKRVKVETRPKMKKEVSKKTITLDTIKLRGRPRKNAGDTDYLMRRKRKYMEEVLEKMKQKEREKEQRKKERDLQAQKRKEIALLAKKKVREDKVKIAAYEKLVKERKAFLAKECQRITDLLKNVVLDKENWQARLEEFQQWMNDF